MKTESQNPETTPAAPSALSRRSFLGAGAALAGARALLDPRAALAEEQAASADPLDGFVDAQDDVARAGIAELQSRMQAGQLTSLELVQRYQRRIQRIDREVGVHAVLQVNPDAERSARELDRERAQGRVRGPLHGIPLLVKDNIDTGDRMMTTAGSLGLVGQPALQDATVVARLRRAGAVILGKTNLSEWANFRGFNSSSGWSGVGGQTSNPYVLDRNPCGSSSGSGAAVAAALCAAALGTETDGSIVCPASACGVVGIKPTVGLTSRAGVVPISSTQDTVGVHGRTVADAAAVLGALTGVDPRDAKTAASARRAFRDYVQFVNPDGLRGARIGVPRQITGPVTEETDPIFEGALQVLRDAGAEVIDNVVLPSYDVFQSDASELVVLIFEFKRELNAYLATRRGVPITDLASAIQFNRERADVELAYFGQQYMELAQADTYGEAEYRDALARGRLLAADQGIDAALRANDLDALVTPTNSPAWPTDLVTGDCFQYGSSTYSAVAGYPIVTVPMGYAFWLPLGLSFLGTAYSEPMLIRLASGFEASAVASGFFTPHRPTFLRSVPDATRARLGARRQPSGAAPNALAPDSLAPGGGGVTIFQEPPPDPSLPQPPIEPVHGKSLPPLSI